MTCNGLPFFPANFMLQAPDHEDDHHPPPPPLNPIMPPQDFHGVASFLGKRSMSFSGIDVWDQEGNGEDDLSDDGSQAGEKKRRLNTEQVRTLEKSFELGNKLEPERKMQLARALGLQPRQVAIWFQNRRARWKTKQLEKDYDLLKTQFEALKTDNDALQAHNHKLKAEILALRNRESTESINLNKDTEGSCSNRSDNSSDIKLDISTTPAIDSPLITSHHHHHHHQHQQQPVTSRPLFPSSSSSSMSRPTGGGVAHLFPNPSSRPDHHSNKSNTDQMVKEESFTNMFCGMDDQPGFWPWLDQQQHFN